MATFSGWLDKVSVEESLQIMDDLSLRHAAFGGDVGVDIATLVLKGDYSALANYEISYHDNWDVLQLMNCRQALAFYTKFEPLPLDVDKEEVAYQKFRSSELACFETNRLFRMWTRGTCSFLPSVVMRLDAARRKISRVLGPVPTVDELKLTFGPGSTPSIKKREACPQMKLSETPTCSIELLRSLYFSPLLRSMPHWLDCHSEVTLSKDPGYEVASISVAVSCGALQFVPKNAKTYRSIDMQPTLNTLIQGGIGRFMSDRLRSVGVDIRDQVPNQNAARTGSVDGSLATLDLSSASDTISRELVRYLLPYEWYQLLAAANCATTMYRGNRIELEKFSSMGNGFTFPLETLIFWALAASACEGDVTWLRVYGDDIVCPTEHCADIVAILTAAGFSLNASKSFTSGPFRESCGADYYKGIDIRPYYQDTEVSGETLFCLHNFYIRHNCEEMADVVLAIIPQPLRRFGPDGFGDGHLISHEWPSYRPRLARRRGYGGVYFNTYKHIPSHKISVLPGDYVTPLYVIYASDGVKPAPICGPLQSSESFFAEYCEKVKLSMGVSQRVSPDGRPCWPVPGSQGYEEVSIYTFAVN